MTAIRATVHRGKLVVSQATQLPEGTVVDLVADDEGDDLDEAERRALHPSIQRAWASVKRGQGRPAEQVIAKLRKRR